MVEEDVHDRGVRALFLFGARCCEGDGGDGLPGAEAVFRPLHEVVGEDGLVQRVEDAGVEEGDEAGALVEVEVVDRLREVEHDFGDEFAVVALEAAVARVARRHADDGRVAEARDEAESFCGTLAGEEDVLDFGVAVGDGGLRGLVFAVHVCEEFVAEQ